MFEMMHRALEHIHREELNQHHREQIHDIDKIISDIWNTDGCTFELLNEKLNHITIDIMTEAHYVVIGLISCDGQSIQYFEPSEIRLLLSHLISNGFLIVNY